MKEDLKKLLSQRHKVEEDFHNIRYKALKRRHRISRRQDISRSYMCFDKLREDVRDLKVLDFGCGDGWTSIELAKEGALVWGIDISNESIKRSSEWALQSGLSDKTVFKKMPGEKLDFADQTFDLVLGSAILHHTELEFSIKEIHRVLKKGGKGIFIEPMNQNPILKWWRKLTPSRRSSAERALTHEDIEFIKKMFPKAQLHFFGFLTIITAGVMILFGRTALIENAHVFFGRADDKLFKIFPLLGEYCSTVVLELYK